MASGDPIAAKLAAVASKFSGELDGTKDVDNADGNTGPVVRGLRVE